MRYFVRDNSWFDTHDYDIPLIKNTLKEAGATHIRTRNRWDWSNQPAVVTFRAEEWELDRITEYLQKAFQTEWIMLEPMWGKKGSSIDSAEDRFEKTFLGIDNKTVFERNLDRLSQTLER